MSADSEAKRRSALNILPAVSIVAIPGDGEIDNYDRTMATWLYAGIFVGEPAVVVVVEEEVPAPRQLVGGAALGVWPRRPDLIPIPEWVWEDEEILLLLL